MTTRWSVVFDGSTEPGTVTLSDGVIEARAHFETDKEARVFFGLLNELKDDCQSEYLRVSRIKNHLKEALRASNE